MPICKVCKLEKLDMDMTFNDLCKNCFINNENDYWKLKSIKALKPKREKGLLKTNE